MTKPTHRCTRCSRPCLRPPLCGDCRRSLRCPVCRRPGANMNWCAACKRLSQDIAAALRYEQVLVKEWEATRVANIRCYRVGKMLPGRGIRAE